MKAFLFLLLVFPVLISPALAQTPVPQAAPAQSQDDLLEIPKEEAWQIFQSCKNDRQLSLMYDCECFAAKYFDERIKVGPDADASAIKFNIENTCPNVVAAAGTAYSDCLNNGPLMPTNQPLEQFCTCFANRFARMYGDSKQAFSSILRVRLQTQAMDYCSTPR